MDVSTQALSYSSIGLSPIVIRVWGMVDYCSKEEIVLNNKSALILKILGEGGVDVLKVNNMEDITNIRARILVAAVLPQYLNTLAC